MSKKVWTYIIGALCILGGVYFIFNPEQSFNNIVYYLGIVLTITGLLKIISSFVNKNELVSPGTKLFSGIINLLFGIILMNNTSLTIKIVTTFIGIYLIITSGCTLSMLLNVKNNNEISNRILVQCIFKLILGIVVLTTPIISIVLTGWVFGVILILIGIYVIINERSDKKTYKVRVKH